MGQITVAEMGVEALTNRLQKDLYNLDIDQNEYDESWFSDFMDHFQAYQGMARGFEHARALSLAILQKRWDGIKPEIKNKLGYTFQSFSTTWTGKEWSTVDNWCRTANVWLGRDKVRMPNTVRIFERNPDGSKAKDAEGNLILKEVPFNPWLVDLSKLLRLNSRAVKGEITDRLWELLADPTSKVEDIDAEIVIREEKKISLRYIVVGPMLLVCEGEEEACIAEIDFDPYYYGPPESLHKRGIETLLNLLNVRLDEEKMVIEQHRKNME